MCLSTASESCFQAVRFSVLSVTNFYSPPVCECIRTVWVKAKGDIVTKYQERMKLICSVPVLQEKLKVGHHGERSLESFCHWQYQEFGGPRYLGTNHVPGGRDDIPPVDTAVLVTRYVVIKHNVMFFHSFFTYIQLNSVQRQYI